MPSVASQYGNFGRGSADRAAARYDVQWPANGNFITGQPQPTDKVPMIIWSIQQNRMDYAPDHRTMRQELVECAQLLMSNRAIAIRNLLESDTEFARWNVHHMCDYSARYHLDSDAK